MSSPNSPTAENLANRYGRTRNKLSRRNKIWLISVAAVLVVLFVSWLTFGRGPGADNKLLGYSVTDATQTVVEFQVTKPIEATAQCAVQALDNSFAVVGWQIVSIPADTAGPATSNQKVALRTDSLAVSATIDSCWIAEN